MLQSLELRFAAKLQERLTELLNTAHRDLGSGSQIVRDDAAATGMACARYIGKIEGIKDARKLLLELHKEMNGQIDDNTKGNLKNGKD